MSEQGDYFCEFTMALSSHDFCAMILYDFLGDKSCEECFASMTMLGKKSLAKPTMTA